MDPRVETWEKKWQCIKNVSPTHNLILWVVKLNSFLSAITIITIFTGVGKIANFYIYGKIRSTF